MTHNELIQAMAKRAGELSTESMASLRLTHPDNISGTKSGVQWVGLPKGKLIEQILYDEFDVESDYVLSSECVDA